MKLPVQYVLDNPKLPSSVATVLLNNSSSYRQRYEIKGQVELPLSMQCSGAQLFSAIDIAYDSRTLENVLLYYFSCRRLYTHVLDVINALNDAVSFFSVINIFYKVCDMAI